MTPAYKYNEPELVQELMDYITATYGQHYSQNKFQTTEFVIDQGHGIGFAIGNIIKYAQRYGKKGDEETARKDLLKTLHYAIIALHVHDTNFNPLEEEVEAGVTETEKTKWYHF